MERCHPSCDDQSVLICPLSSHILGELNMYVKQMTHSDFGLREWMFLRADLTLVYRASICQ